MRLGSVVWAKKKVGSLRGPAPPSVSRPHCPWVGASHGGPASEASHGTSAGDTVEDRDLEELGSLIALATPAPALIAPATLPRAALAACADIPWFHTVAPTL